MFTRLKNLWRLSDIETPPVIYKGKSVGFSTKNLLDSIKGKKLATIIDMDEPVEEFKEKEI